MKAGALMSFHSAATVSVRSNRIRVFARVGYYLRFQARDLTLSFQLCMRDQGVANRFPGRRATEAQSMQHLAS